MPFNAALEKTTTMKRWKKVEQYDNQKHLKIKYPGDLPVHNPVNWGHTQYNEDVLAKLDGDIFDELRSKKLSNEHFKPEDLKKQITAVKDKFWGDLRGRGALEGMSGKFGIKANMKARYDENNDGWWKPLCMVDVPEPASPP